MVSELFTSGFALVLGFSALQAVLILAVLLHRGISSVTAKWLFWLLVGMGSVLLHHCFYLSVPEELPVRYYFNGMAAAWWFTVPVLFLRYVQSLFDIPTSHWSALLFLPGIYHLVSWLFAWAGIYPNWLLWLGDFAYLYDIIWVGGYVVLGLFCSLSARRVLSVKVHSNQLPAEGRWLLRWATLFAGALIVTLVVLVLLAALRQYSALFEFSLLMVFAAFVLGLAFQSLRRSAYPGWMADQLYGDAAISKPDLTQILTNLEQLIKTDAPHLNPDLRRSDLADRLGVSEHSLGQVFTRHLNGNFYSYINSRRLEAFESSLLAGALDEMNVAGLARACGFKSKTSLYRVFREKHGVTPTAWLQQSDVQVSVR